MVDVFEFLDSIWISYFNRKNLLELPEFSYFTTHLEATNEGLRIDYWCNDANFAFRRIKKENPYSIIVTSGTLSPLDAFE